METAEVNQGGARPEVTAAAQGGGHGAELIVGEG
jgi:hypothetical protein